MLCHHARPPIDKDIKMFIVFEISRPFQLRPGFYSSSLTWFRIWWLWFAISLHPMRMDELLEMAGDGIASWERKTLLTRT
jgi:hypothetical protein